jgi:hypothetical protein
MASDTDSFENRLHRINAARGVPERVSSSDPGFTPSQRPKSGFGAKWIFGYLLFAVLCLGVVAVLFVKISDFPRLALGGVDANLQGADATSAELGLIDRLVGMVYPFGGNQNGDPIAFLPPAPEGWVRVTEADAQMPGALQTLVAQWSALSDASPLEENAGYQSLTQFLALNEKPDVEGKVLSETRADAFYLSDDGEFLLAQLKYLPEQSPLGALDDGASWIEGLAAIETAGLADGEILERLQLGGLEVTNRTNPNGKSQLIRPIGTDIYAANGMKIAVPLTGRAIFRIEGLAKPFVAQTLIASINRGALLARHD